MDENVALCKHLASVSTGSRTMDPRLCGSSTKVSEAGGRWLHWRTEVGPLEEIVPRTALSCGPSIRAVQECPQHGIRWRRLCDHMLPRGMHVPSGRSMSARGVRIEPIAATGQRRSVSWMHAARYGAASGVGAWRSSSSRRREARSYMCQKQARYMAPAIARPPTSRLAEELWAARSKYGAERGHRSDG